MQGLAAQENIANLANQQIVDTISGQYSNPFLSPIIADAASSVYTNVAQQFSGAGELLQVLWLNNKQLVN